MNLLGPTRTITACALAALSLTACVVAPYPAAPVAYTTPGETYTVAPMAPPAPYVETVPAMPYAGAVWINGYWNWSGGRHQWMPGHYARPMPGYHWRPHRWAPSPRGGWQLHGGGWAR